MQINLDEPFWKMFTVFIQIGAILAVVVYFRHKIVQLLSGSVSGNTVAPFTRMEAPRSRSPLTISGVLARRCMRLMKAASA